MTRGPAILFVHLGAVLPPWTIPALRQARLFNTGSIILVAEAAALADASLPSDITAVTMQSIGLSEMQRRFRQIAPMDSSFRDGFWRHTTERFFVVESAMRQLGLGAVLHLENDVMLYADLEKLAPPLASLYPGIAATFDSDHRAIPGLVWFANAASAARLCHFILAALEQLQQPGINDMTLLGLFRQQGARCIDALPVIPPDYPAPLRVIGGRPAQSPDFFSRHFAILGQVFDAAALGQYLGGTDPRNPAAPGPGFINESAVYDPAVLKPRFITDPQGRKVPVIESPSGLHPVANLHIHAKNLAAFASC